MRITRQEYYDRLSSFILSLPSNEGKFNGSLAEGDHLWDLGLLDSFSTVELLLFLEDMMGVNIEVNGDSLKSLHSLKSMYDVLIEPNLKGA